MNAAPAAAAGSRLRRQRIRFAAAAACRAACSQIASSSEAVNRNAPEHHPHCSGADRAATAGIRRRVQAGQRRSWQLERFGRPG